MTHREVTDTEFDVGVLLARAHRSRLLVFWTADDWQTMLALNAQPLDDQRAVVRVRVVGNGRLASE